MIWKLRSSARNFTSATKPDAAGYELGDTRRSRPEAGITAIDGDLRDGGIIRIRMGQSRGLRLRVHQLPGEAMRWQAALPLGLLRRAFTVVLTLQPGLTRLRITHGLSGALSPFAGTTEEALHSFVQAVRERAELLDRHS